MLPTNVQLKYLITQEYRKMAKFISQSFHSKEEQFYITKVCLMKVDQIMSFSTVWHQQAHGAGSVWTQLHASTLFSVVCMMDVLASWDRTHFHNRQQLVI